MTKPWKYRPEIIESEYEGDDANNGSIDWEDNWLSNTMAWASVSIGIENAMILHRIANPFWTDCPTCLFFRGATIGAIISAVIAAII